MAQRERDALTGRLTTGHEWDGIKELSTPIPTWWITTFLISIMVALIYLWLMPSFATTKSLEPGLLGWSSRGELREEQAIAAAAQAPWRQRLMAVPLEEVSKDEELRRFVQAGGRALFNENCAPCHGVGGGGQQGQFPALLDDDWLWGGKPADIIQTVRHGIRNTDEESRQSAMPVFGDSLSKEQIANVADYVLTLADKSKADSRVALPGATLFKDNCAGCHGENGEGGRDFGAPRLNDAIWLYGGSRDAIIHQITSPRMGSMPSFASRLNEESLRMLALYVHGLGGGE